MDEMDMIDRPIAITDLETTGLDERQHEIIEIGLILAHQQTLEVLDTLEVKVRPENIERASLEALRRNGYSAELWKDAISLQDATQQYAERTRNAMFAAHNVAFDWAFLREAFRRTQVRDLMDYHRVDLFTIAWEKLSRSSDLKKFNLAELCRYFHIPEEPEPHRAINGARCAYEVFKRLRTS